jgi:hypothetical protein
MNWKGTIILAGLAAVTFAAWFLLQPTAETGAVRERPFEWRESMYQSIVIRRADQPEVVLLRQPSPVQGSLWHLSNPTRPVDDSRVAEMIAALRRLSRDRAIKPGDAEHTPSTYGLDKPVVSVEVTASGEKRTVKFGNPSIRLPDTRFFMIEGEPEIYYGPADTAGPFQRSIADIRSRSFITYDPARVVRMEVSRKYLRAGSDNKPGLKSEYEKLKFEFREQPAAGRKGWYLVGINDEPRNEKAEDGKVGHLIAGLRELKAEEYVPVAKPEDFDFNEPEMVVRLDVLQPPSNSTQSLLVEVGRSEDKAARKMTYVRLDGGGEAALVSAAAVDRLPRERKLFVSLDFIDFDFRLLESVEMLSDTGHRVKLEKIAKEESRGDEKWKSENWIVTQPAGLPVEQNAANDFVNGMTRVTIADILGEQPDMAVFGLDQPALTLTFTVRPKTGEPQVRVYKFGRRGDSPLAYLLKPDSKEVYQLAEEFWRKIERTDLNFRKLEIFNIASTAIVAMSFSYRPDHLSANPVKYAVRRGEGGKWEFEDPVLRKEGAKVDSDRMDNILGQLNYVRAESFITRSPRGARDLELIDKEPMGRLVIRYADPANPGKAAEKAFRFSKSFVDSTGRARMYYAKMEPAAGDTSPSSDATIVFRIKTEFVEILRQGVIFEPPPPK